MAWNRDLGEQVWALHLALTKAALIDPSLYSITADEACNIREDAENREEQEALAWILAAASPLVPLAFVRQAQAVAREIWRASGFPGGHADADAEVDAWLRWLPDSGAPPPYST
ncbi:MAG: hypothetical protein JWP74_4177 [Marmoricola sp.]|nr:hypothetical protein [Marmoricola sp.]